MAGGRSESLGGVMKIKGIMIEDIDQVVTLVGAASPGDSIVYRQGAQIHELTAVESIPIYHKISCAEIRKGGLVYKYGQPIGTATQDIRPGEWVHIHNLKSTSLVD